MTVYKVFYKNYQLKKGELMGMLIERRTDLRGMRHGESGLRWAKLAHSAAPSPAFEGGVRERRLGSMLSKPWPSGRGVGGLAFGNVVKDKQSIFVVPNEFKLERDTNWLMGKGVFTKEELLGMVELIGQEIQRATSSDPFQSESWKREAWG